jgi:signal peptidase I
MIVVATALVVLLAASATWLRRSWIVVGVAGNSMAPTLLDGQTVVARRVARKSQRRIQRSEIIVFRLAQCLVEGLGSQDLPLRVKRVAFVAGDPLPSWATTEPWAKGLTDVPTGKVLVIGDNPKSQDSRQLGFVDVKSILAIVPAAGSSRC